MGNGYEHKWAIISGGQPTEKYPDGCTTKKTGTNGSGFWFFTRDKVPSVGTMQEMEAAAKKLGFTTSQLIDVPQDGCTYAEEKLKAMSEVRWSSRRDELQVGAVKRTSVTSCDESSVDARD